MMTLFERTCFISFLTKRGQFTFLAEYQRAPLRVVCAHVFCSYPRTLSFLRSEAVFCLFISQCDPLHSVWSEICVQFVKLIIFLLSELTSYLPELIELTHYSDIALSSFSLCSVLPAMSQEARRKCRGQKFIHQKLFYKLNNILNWENRNEKMSVNETKEALQRCLISQNCWGCLLF